MCALDTTTKTPSNPACSADSPLSYLLDKLMSEECELVLESFDGSLVIVGVFAEATANATLLKQTLHLVRVASETGTRLEPLDMVKRDMELVPLTSFSVQDASPSSQSSIRGLLTSYREFASRLYSRLDLSAAGIPLNMR